MNYIDPDVHCLKKAVKLNHQLTHLLPWSLNQFPPIFMNELYSVMMFLNFSTELPSLMQSIISYAEMAEN